MLINRQSIRQCFPKRVYFSKNQNTNQEPKHKRNCIVFKSLELMTQQDKWRLHQLQCQFAARWVLTNSRCNSYRRLFREYVSLASLESKPHKELTPSRIKSDMEAVASVIDVFQNVFCSPWSRDAVSLISLSTGLLATPEVKDDLMLILEGRAHVENFCKNDFL